VAVDLAQATRAIQALLPDLEVTMERPTPFTYRVTLRRGDRSRTVELFPGPEDTAKAFEEWVLNASEDPLGLAACFRALADRITDRPKAVSFAALTLTCPRCGNRDLRLRFHVDYLTAERRCPACWTWFILDRTQ
jgi:hypothetical protein